MSGNDACLHYMWDFKFFGTKHDMACCACGASVPYLEAATFLPAGEMQKTPNADDFRKAAIKCLEQKRLKQLVINKATGKIHPLREDCVHPKAEWRDTEAAAIMETSSPFEWVVGRMYRTRGGLPARFFDANLNQMSASLELSDAKIFCVGYKDGLHDTDSSLDIIGLWEQATVQYLQVCAARDGLTPDNRRPRVDLRTDAQIAQERAVQRLQQHKLARWGMAEHVRWEDEL